MALAFRPLFFSSLSFDTRSKDGQYDMTSSSRLMNEPQFAVRMPSCSLSSMVAPEEAISGEVASSPNPAR